MGGLRPFQTSDSVLPCVQCTRTRRQKQSRGSRKTSEKRDCFHFISLTENPLQIKTNCRNIIYFRRYLSFGILMPRVGYRLLQRSSLCLDLDPRLPGTTRCIGYTRKPLKGFLKITHNIRPPDVQKWKRLFILIYIVWYVYINTG